jgi:thiamine biosynthesis protein ThiI
VKYLLRWGEIGLKSSHVRREMKSRLVTNISRLFREEGGRCTFVEEGGRLFVESDHPKAYDILRRAFGVVSFSPVQETSSSIDDILQLARGTASSRVKQGTSFAVRARRVGDHPYTSMDLARGVGAAILSDHPELRVDLDEPDWEIHVEVRDEKAYIYTEVVVGPGGLPLGSQGKVVALVEEGRGVLASWLMMKRGCAVLPVFRKGEGWAKAIRRWDPDSSPCRIQSLEDMETIAQSEGALGYVYPWGVDEVREQDLRPAFYPLLGMSDENLEELRRRVLIPLGLG